MIRRKIGETIITSGKFRGRKIRTPGGETHPMGSREKIALFNMIQSYLLGASVLDAYAGSGALGLEAISRGAEKVVFADNSPWAVAIIRENIATLGLEDSEWSIFDEDIMLMAQAFTEIGRKGIYDIVLADPPYDEYRPKIVTGLAKLVAPNGLLVVSTPVPPPEVEGMETLQSRKYAQAHITIYKCLG